MDLTKQAPAPFDPTHPRFRWRLWLRLATPTGTFVHVYWRRVAAVLALLAVIAWLGASVAVWSFVKFRRGHTGARFIDVAFYPVRRTEFRTSLGQFYVQLGRDEISRRNYLTGYRMLQAGLARIPEDLTARRLVAFTQVRLGRSDLALKTLAAGAQRSRDDLEFLKLLFGLLLEAQEDERILELCRELLPPRPDQVRAHQFTALQAATALHHRGHYDESDQLINDWRLGDSLEGQLLLARNDWERGLPELALTRLEGQFSRFQDRDESYLELIKLNRHLARHAEARRYAVLRQLRDPVSPGPRADLIHTYRNAGDTAAEQREIESYLVNFKSDPAALILLAWFAVDTAQPALAERIHALAREAGFVLTAFDLARAQAALAARDYQRAIDFAAESLRASSGENNTFVASLNGLRALAYYGLKDQARADVALASFLEQSRPRAVDAVVMARELRALDAHAAARSVLDRACVIDPHSQAALAELVRLDAEIGRRDQLAGNLTRYLQMRKPSRAVLEEVLLRLDRADDGPLREKIRAALQQVTTTPAP